MCGFGYKLVLQPPGFASLCETWLWRVTVPCRSYPTHWLGQPLGHLSVKPPPSGKTRLHVNTWSGKSNCFKYISVFAFTFVLSLAPSVSMITSINSAWLSTGNIQIHETMWHSHDCYGEEPGFACRPSLIAIISWIWHFIGNLETKTNKKQKTKKTSGVTMGSVLKLVGPVSACYDSVR